MNIGFVYDRCEIYIDIVNIGFVCYRCERYIEIVNIGFVYYRCELYIDIVNIGSVCYRCESCIEIVNIGFPDGHLFMDVRNLHLGPVRVRQVMCVHLDEMTYLIRDVGGE